MTAPPAIHVSPPTAGDAPGTRRLGWAWHRLAVPRQAPPPMNPIGLTADRVLPGIAPSLPAAPWSQSWSHRIATAPTEPNAASPKPSAPPTLTPATKFGRVTDLAVEASALFRAVPASLGNETPDAAVA